MEKENADSLDRAADPFGMMIADLSDYVLKEFATEYTRRLCYSIGKWVYLIDALDDYDKDAKKGRYNVLRLAYGRPTLKEAVKEGEGELVFIFDNLFADMRAHLAAIKFNFNHDLTDNIILRGIPLKTRHLVYGTCKDGECEKK